MTYKNTIIIKQIKIYIKSEGIGFLKWVPFDSHKK